MTTGFGAYLVVDWSANKTPKLGADSIWWCLVTRRRGALVVARLENASTRDRAEADLLAVLRDLASKETRVLVGYDFPLGYPTGLAAKLGLAGSPWRALWDELRALVVDDQPRGTNNRFLVAGELNRRVGADAGPFWGAPRGHEYPDLRATAPVYPVAGLARARLCEAHVRGPQPCWKLCGVGSVGSQALLGVPRVARIRDHEALRASSRVWPFETDAALPSTKDALVVHAEVYPSLVPTVPVPGRVKDSLQVEGLARFFARADAAGELGGYFEAPARLDARERARAVTEEGWILGVTPRASGS